MTRLGPKIPRHRFYLIHQGREYSVTEGELRSFAIQYAPEIARGMSHEIAVYMFLLGSDRIEPPIPGKNSA